MKAISIKQPFTMMIANGLKTLEIRTQKTKYRGKLLICAAQKIHAGNCIPNQEVAYVGCQAYYSELAKNRELKAAQTGYAICTVDLVECRKMENTLSDKLGARHDFVAGAWVWVFENAKLITPFKQKGKQGFFEVELPIFWEKHQATVNLLGHKPF